MFVDQQVSSVRSSLLFVAMGTLLILPLCGANCEGRENSTLCSNIFTFFHGQRLNCAGRNDIIVREGWNSQTTNFVYVMKGICNLVALRDLIEDIDVTDMSSLLEQNVEGACRWLYNSADLESDIFYQCKASLRHYCLLTEVQNRNTLVGDIIGEYSDCCRQ